MLPLLLKDGLLLAYAVTMLAFLSLCLASFSILEKTSAEDLQLKPLFLSFKGHSSWFKSFPKIVRSLVSRFNSLNSLLAALRGTEVLAETNFMSVNTEHPGRDSNSLVV